MNNQWITVAIVFTLVISAVAIALSFKPRPVPVSTSVQPALDSLRSELDSTKAAFRVYLRNHEAEMDKLEADVAKAEVERTSLERRLKSLVLKDPMDWLRSIPAEERDRVIAHINGKVAEEL